MEIQPDLIHDALLQPTNALAYALTSRLRTLYPDRHIMPTESGYFRVEPFATAGHCTLETLPEPMPYFDHDWHGAAYGLHASAEQGRWRIVWEGIVFELYLLNWEGVGGCGNEVRWLVAPDSESARRFFETVCAWNSELRGEVLVFSGGHWHKSEALYQAIRTATFDNLVLPEELKRELLSDLTQFFAARDLYERYRLPWKRGLLLVGPPGNGKTHTIKALINALGQPCLYVRSFKSRYGTDHDAIRSVFERARQTTPCLLILEDLDSLITDRNRSFFLNELDGFSANTGIVLVATTNHPDRLDPAIVDRPSRFDRKYHFPLPAPAERAAYIALWNAHLEPDLRLSDAGQALATASTDGFSFAYLKELFLSSMMRWINAPQPGGMDGVLESQCHLLREQMNSAALVAAEKPEAPQRHDEDEDEDDEDERY